MLYLDRRCGQLHQCSYWCAVGANNSFMYDIKNGFENNKVQSLAAGHQTLWLGLTCLSNSTTSCVWDSGRALNSRDYTNFNGGYPNADTGACVIMLVSTGKWYSASCVSAQASFGCQYVQGVSVKTYKNSLYLQGKGYFFTGVFGGNVDSARSYCNASCGDLASIHSAGINSLVRDLVSDSSLTYAILGLKYSKGNYYWTDGTPYNYFGFGYQNPSLGSCVAMALQDDVVLKGKWINSQCSSSDFGIVCEKDPTNNCDVEVPTTLAPTLSPLECASPTYLTNSGEINSPGFPRSSLPNTCSYLITEDNGSRVSLTFTTLSLDENSYIYLYNSFFDKAPFATITYGSSTNEPYYSTGNMLKVVFNTTGSDDHQNFSQGVFNSVAEVTTETPNPDNCDQSFNGSGTVQSPNFPGSYPIKNRQCATNLLVYDAGGPCVSFDTFDLRNGDYIDLYDDWDMYYRFQRLYFASPFQVFCSPIKYYLIKLVFVTSDQNNYPTNVNGYSARFGTAQYLSETAPESTTYAPDLHACNSTWYTDGDILQSPNYPESYPLGDRDCANIVSVYQRDGACVVFDTFNLRNGDYIDLYDFNNRVRFQRLYNASPNQIFCIPDEEWATMYFQFVTSASNIYPSNVKGFKARFGDRTELGFAGSTPESSEVPL